ncbi:MAG TPA: hypothetical protein VFE54_10115 [Mucilaginibacter sp.]|nr:hypothetical protein [Mucilaginibacter sp.]
MENEFDSVMAERTDAELIAILNGPEGDYQPAAMEAAQRVFDKRKLPEQQVASIKQEIKRKQLEDEIKANEPLETRYKVLAFIFPRMYLWFPDSVLDQVYQKKLRELSNWHFYGIAFYISVVLLTLLLEGAFKF